MASKISTPQGMPQSGPLGSLNSPRTWPSMNPFNAPGTDSTSKTDEGVELLSVSWNQDYGCFAAGTTSGFRIYNCDPFKETFRRDLQGGGFGIVEMLFRCNIFALVGGGSVIQVSPKTHPQYPPNKVMIWDDHQSRCIGEFVFHSEVCAVKLRHDLIVVVLEHKIYVYNFTDLKLLHQIETLANPRGLCCLSYDPNTSVLACPGLHKGEVRLEHFGLKVTKFIRAHDSNIACVTLTVDGLLLATASTKGTLIRIFNTLDGTRLQEVRRGLDRADIYSIALSQNLQWLAVSSGKGTVHVFSLRVRGAADDVSNQNTAAAVAHSPVMSHQNSSSSLDALIPQNTGTNTGSSLSFMRGVLPKYFSSEWSFAQFHLPETTRYKTAFGAQNTVMVIGMDGSFYRCSFNLVNGGQMVQREFIRFVDSASHRLKLVP